MLQSMDDAIAVILGGGAGTRLFPLTWMRSKPAVPLAGKYRIIDIPISNCLNSGLNRIFVLTQYNSASLNRHVSNAYRFDRFNKGFVTILAAEQTPASQEWFQGTADAVRRSRHHLEAYRHSLIMILSGDQLYSMDYREMLEFHRTSNAEITLATIPVTAEDCPAFGILKTNPDGLITDFVEKPPIDRLEGLDSMVSEEMEAAGRRYLASMGIYIFNQDVLNAELDCDVSCNDFGREIIPNAIQNRRVLSYPFTGYWSDIGTIRSFYEANLELTKEIPPFDLYNPYMPIYTNARMLPPTKIQSSYIQHSMIADGCIILNSQISNSVIGIRAFIGNNTTIKNSVVMGADYYPWHDRSYRDRAEGPEGPGIWEESYVEGAIVDRNVRISPNCIITNKDSVQEGEGPNFFIRDGIVILPKNAVLEEGTVI